MMPSAPLRCFPDLSAFGSRFGSSEKRQNAASLFRPYTKKVPDFLRNQELFGGDCWTRTSDLLRVTHFARTKKNLFAAYINRKNTAQLRKEMTATERELDKMVKRNAELSVLFKRLYEDNVLGKISNEQFRMLSADYNAEQKQLTAAIPEKQAMLEKLKASAANVDAFIEKASRHTEITELTPELLWLFIERIDIGKRPGRYNRNGTQEVRIIYRDIGVVDSAMSAEDAESAEVHFIPSLEMVVQQMAAQTQVS